MRGCSTGAIKLDDTEFSKPLPWIGLYVAAASLVCAVAMTIDAYRGFLKRNLWFPSKYFSLNAATLTLLGIATKLPVDLNTSMPGSSDQLTKLSGTVLICTVMGNLMPSLGDMGSSDILSNVIAVAIFVVTVIVNVTIQMGTGVIYVYLPEHVVIMFFMLVLLSLLISSALIVPTTKVILDRQFDMRYNDESNENDERVDRFDPGKLKEYVRKFWVMAHTSSPQYVIGRSATCTASGAFCLVSALILTQAIVRSFVWKSVFCDGSSDYKFSTAVVLIIQTFTAAVGTIAPAVRWFSAVSFKNPESGRYKQVLKVEKYWIQRLQEWKEDPSSYLTTSGRRVRCLRKCAHESKNVCVDALVVMQKGVVMVSKVVRMISVLPVSWVVQCTNLGKVLRKLDSTTSSVTNIDFSQCVLHLEGESDLVGLMMRSERKDTDMWIDRGKNNKPVELTELIREWSSISQGFKGVGEFDKLSDDSDIPHCWALPVVTLASIAVAIQGVDRNSTKFLLKSVCQGLRYARLVEKNLDDEGLLNMRDAADAMWLQLDLYHKWYNVDLHSLISTEEKKEGCKRRIIEKLAKIAHDRVTEFHSRIVRGEEIETGHLEWPGEVLAAHCMNRICATILSNHDAYNKTNEDLFGWIRKTIADILGACLTNLPRVIYMECFCCAIEVREESVRAAAFLLGEAEDLLPMLRNPEVACFYPENKEHIWEWRNRTSPEVV